MRRVILIYQDIRILMPENHYMVSILGTCNFYCAFFVIRLTRMYYCQCCVAINFIIYHMRKDILIRTNTPWYAVCAITSGCADSNPQLPLLVVAL